jgi:hypothetical protein
MDLMDLLHCLLYRKQKSTPPRYDDSNFELEVD